MAPPWLDRAGTGTFRVLLCTEACFGRGHVTTLSNVARALGPAHVYQAILPRLTHADVLAPFCDRIDRGAHVTKVSDAPAARRLNWADWFLRHGFCRPEHLLRSFLWWHEALSTIRPDLVVADWAPSVLLAARAVGVRVAVTGVSFCLPPAALERFPDYLTPEQATSQGTIVSAEPPPDEAAIRDSINRTLGPRGLPELRRLSEVYAADLSLPTGLALWDPYAPWRDRPLLPPVARMPPLQDGRGGEVFIYFSTSELADPATVDALRQLPYPARLVAPGLAAEMALDLARNLNLRIEPEPLSQDAIVARARVIVCAGQAGTLGLAILAGIPVLALPTQLEQMSNAVRASAHLAGVRVLPRRMRSTEAILDTVADLWSRRGLAEGARQDAARLRAEYPESGHDTYRRLLTPLLHRA